MIPELTAYVSGQWREQLAKGAVWQLASFAIFAFANLLGLAIIARTLDSAALGSYATLAATAALVSGMATLPTKAVATIYSVDSNVGGRWSFGMGTAEFIAVSAVLLVLGATLFSEHVVSLLVFGAAFKMRVLSQTVGVLIRTAWQTHTLVPVALTRLLCYPLGLAMWGDSIASIAWVTALAELVSLAAAVGFLASAWGKGRLGAGDAVSLERPGWDVLLYGQVSATAVNVSVFAPRLLLSLYHQSPELTAAYFLTQSVVAVGTTPAFPMGEVLQTEMRRRTVDGVDTRPLLRRSIVVTGVVGVAVTVLLLILSPLIIGFFGSHYAHIPGCYVLIMLPIAAVTWLNVPVVALATGRARLLPVCVADSAGMAVILAALVFPFTPVVIPLGFLLGRATSMAIMYGVHRGEIRGMLRAPAV